MGGEETVRGGGGVVAKLTFDNSHWPSSSRPFPFVNSRSFHLLIPVLSH